MKKYFVVLFIILISCNSDDLPDDNPIDNPSFNVELLLNRWKFDQININGIQYVYQHQPNCQKDEFTFANQEGQIRQYNELIFINDICSTNSLNMEWRIKNDVISCYFGIQKVIDFKVISVSNSSLVYSYSLDIDNDNVNDNIIIFAIPYE